MDGQRAFPDQNPTQGQYGNEPSCPGLQSEASDEIAGN